MSCFVLVHGSWHGSWCWNRVVPLLKARGHTVVAPDLPGHGEDRTPLERIDLDAYADRVTESVAEQDEPVVLVGHSMGGAVITHAAERSQENLGMLVYLAGYIPMDGGSVADQAIADAHSLMQRHLVVDPESGWADLEPVAYRECFYGDCSAEDLAFATERLRMDPLGPLMAPIRPTEERWGRVPRVYIECLKDRTLTPDMQRKIQAQSGCKQVLSMDTSHSPFFSDPERLVELLLEAASPAD